MRAYQADDFTLEYALGHAMDHDDLTYGEAVAMLLLTDGQRAWNNNPGVFKNMEPIKE